VMEACANAADGRNSASKSTYMQRPSVRSMSPPSTCTW
jgi:hypothetical protein